MSNTVSVVRYNERQLAQPTAVEFSERDVLTKTWKRRNKANITRNYLYTETHTFLADRTKGRPYATVLCLSSSVTLCIAAKRCVL